LTWNTDDGSPVVVGHEAEMIRRLAVQLTETIREYLGIGQPLNFGVPLFEAMTWQQQTVMVDQVLKRLVDPTTQPQGSPTTQPQGSSALMDSSVAALYAQLYQSVEIETETERLDEAKAEPPSRRWRQLIVQVLEEIDDQAEWAQIDSTDMDDWDVAIQCLKDLVLPDEDYLMESLALDLPPEQSQTIKRSMGISDDYFVDVPPDVTTGQAQHVWAELVRYCDGRTVDPGCYP
jgi:hypothetical protein